MKIPLFHISITQVLQRLLSSFDWKIDCVSAGDTITLYAIRSDTLTSQ